jgi:hypothetical protein
VGRWSTACVTNASSEPGLSLHRHLSVIDEALGEAAASTRTGRPLSLARGSGLTAHSAPVSMPHVRATPRGARLVTHPGLAWG